MTPLLCLIHLPERTDTACIRSNMNIRTMENVEKVQISIKCAHKVHTRNKLQPHFGLAVSWMLMQIHYQNADGQQNEEPESSLNLAWLMICISLQPYAAANSKIENDVGFVSILSEKVT